MLCWPWHGLEAKALAWLLLALALQNCRPRPRGLALAWLGLAWPGFGPGQGFSYRGGRLGERVYGDGGGGDGEGVHKDGGGGNKEGVYECHDPSHGGSYMAEGAFFIRIGLPPHVVSGDCLASSSHSMPPSLFARACSMSDVCDLGVVLVRLICLMIMRVGACLHDTLYPMTGCVLYLNRLLCWRCSLGLLMLPRLPYDSNTNSYCTWVTVL